MFRFYASDLGGGCCRLAGSPARVEGLWRIHPVNGPILRWVLLDLGRDLLAPYGLIAAAMNRPDHPLRKNTPNAPTGPVPSYSGGFWCKRSVAELFQEHRVWQAAGVAYWNRSKNRLDGWGSRPDDEVVRVENAHPAIITTEEAESLLAPPGAGQT